MSQGHNKSFIFENQTDTKYFIKIMNQLKQTHQIKIISYCIMKNHYHMLVYTNDIVNLSEYMHKINTKYAIYYNAKYEKVGYVFRNRFKSQPITDENYYYNCIKYIYNNPVKAHICSNPYNYPYSNIHEYVKHNNKISTFEIDNNCNYIDIEEEVIKCSEVIEKFLENNRIDKDYLKISKNKLIELIDILKNNYKYPYRTIEKELNMSREKLRKIIKNKKD